MKAPVIGETEDRITEAALHASAAKLVSPASVLMVMRSGILKHSFPVAVTDRAVTVNQDLRALTPHDGVLAEYLAGYLARASHAILDTCSKDGTTVNSIDAKALASFPVPLAPLGEQRRIVAQMDELFSEIDEGEAALVGARKGLEVFRRSLLNAAVTGELARDWRESNPVLETADDLLDRCHVEVEAGIRGEPRRKPTRAAPTLDTAALPPLPENWTWEPLGRLSWASSYGTSTKCDTTAPGVPVLRIPNIRAGAIVDAEMKFATTDLGLEAVDYLSPGDLLIIRTNGSKTLIGRAGVALETPSTPTYFASYLIRFRLLGGELTWKWVSTFFESPTVRSWISGQIASSAGQYNVSQTSLATLPIPIPPASEAAEILRRVTEAWAATADTLATLDAEAADAAHLRKSILKAAFEGHLVQQDPTDEPASELLAHLKSDNAAKTPRRPRRAKVTA